MLSKAKVSAVLMRFGRLNNLVIRLYRRTRPFYSAGVTGVLFNERGEVLLLEHVFHTAYPWGLPGGWLDRKEEPDAALIREFAEETALDVEIAYPVMVQRGLFWGMHLDIVYRVAPKDPAQSIALSFEHTDFGWYALDALPKLSRFHHRCIDAALALERTHAL